MWRSSRLPQIGFQFGWFGGGAWFHDRMARTRGSTGRYSQQVRILGPTLIETA